MNKRIIITILLVIAGTAATSATAQEQKDSQKKVFTGYSGGMMVHTGYLSGGDNPFGYEPKGATFGIGGVARVHLWKHLRVGFEGYVSTMGLDDATVRSGSHNKVFWTGLLADGHWHLGKKFYLYSGATVGGGVETAGYIFEGDKTDWIPEISSVYNKQPFFAVDPFIGVEYAVGRVFRLTLKADWLLAVHHGRLNLPTGPRLYLGCIFSH